MDATDRDELGGPNGAGGTMPPVEFDPFSPTFYEDPYDTYRRLRDEAPVYRNERYGFYALTRYDDVCTASKDWARFTSTHGVDLSTLTTRLHEPIDTLIMMDPPKHDRLRALVSRVFTPRAVAALEPMVRQVIVDQLDSIPDPSAFDAIVDFAGPFPVEVISRMLGVPEHDRQQIRHWLDLGLARAPGQVDPSDEGITALIEMGAYMYGLAETKRAHPGDDMISHLVECEVDTGDGIPHRLDDMEIAGFAALIGGAGAETVTKLVGNAFVLFGRHPDQFRKVVDDPERSAGAVEEVLRILPPSQYQGRFSMEDTEWHGEVIPAGHPVLLVTGAALRDERAIHRPDEFDIDRPPALALGFGYGIHSCLGAALARLESRIAIEEMARRWPDYAVDEEAAQRVQMSNVAGYSSLPVQAPSVVR